MDALERAEWDEFVSSRPEANFLQSWDFYEFHVARGKRVVRRLVRDGSSGESRIVGAYAGVVETAKRGRYLAIAGGPLIDWNDTAVVRAVFADIRKQGARCGCVFVRVRPQLPVSEESLALMRELGLTTVFGNPGTTEVPFLNEWPDDFRYVLGLQESVATSMADGFAQ